jgi:hypothetical protein
MKQQHPVTVSLDIVDRKSDSKLKNLILAGLRIREQISLFTLAS